MRLMLRAQRPKIKTQTLKQNDLLRDQNHEPTQKLAAVSIWRTAQEVGLLAASTQRAEKWFAC